MEVAEEEGSSEMTAEIKLSGESIEGAVLFHMIVDILGFVLFMHHQIPSNVKWEALKSSMELFPYEAELDMSLQFEGLQSECKELELILKVTEGKASLRRLHAARMREAKRGIKKMEKLMKIVSSFRTALQLLITEVSDVGEVMLILGSNPGRPLHVYELCFFQGKVISKGNGDITRTKAAEGLSRKAIRSLISSGAGSNSYEGPTKLFLLVKAPSSLNMPTHFLPKRDFRYHKKTVPFRLRFQCKTKEQESGGQNFVSQTTESVTLDHPSGDLIWFQCRHVIKGIPSKTSSVED